MNYGSQGNEGQAARHAARHERGPYWKRAHRDWRIWAGVFLMMAAIIIYVLSDNFALLPNGAGPRPAATSTEGR